MPCSPKQLSPHSHSLVFLGNSWRCRNCTEFWSREEHAVTQCKQNALLPSGLETVKEDFQSVTTLTRRTPCSQNRTLTVTAPVIPNAHLIEGRTCTVCQVKYTRSLRKQGRVCTSCLESRVAIASQGKDLFSYIKSSLEIGCLVLDTETTGVSSESEIIEIGIVNQRGETVFESLVKPQTRIPEFIVGIHGISNEMVRNAPTWADIFPKLSAILHGQQVWMYNSPFDVRLMDQTSARYQLSMPVFKVECAMRAYTNATERTRWVSLTNACAEIGVSSGGHRALADALAALKVLQSIAQS